VSVALDLELARWLSDLTEQIDKSTGQPFSERWLANLGRKIEEWEPQP